MIYLACPYSHPNPKVRHWRFKKANKAACSLMQRKLHVFSPISHCHPIALEGDLPLGWQDWAEYDYEMLSHCSELIVLMLDGWKESEGVQAEIEIAKTLGLDILYWGGEGIRRSICVI